LFRDLGDVLTLASRYEEAIDLLQKALKMYESIFGARHPSFANALSSIATAKYFQGKYKEAEEGYLKALELQRESLGNLHPEVATTINDLAGLYLRTRDFVNARKYYEESRDIREEVKKKG